MSAPLDERDLTHVLDHTRQIWTDFRGARVLITGATGFVGSWMLETLVHANDTLKLGLHVTALVRDRAAFVERLPHLAASPIVRAHVGDVRIVDPPTHAFSHYVHCASAAPPRMNAERPDEVIDVIERGTERMLEEAESGRGARFLQVSSGSIYGPQPASLDKLAESYTGRADASDPAQRFGAAKLRAELRGEASVKRGVRYVAARMFAAVGPRLPLDGQFAIGNFLGDAVAGRPVKITGDGTPIRSWIYAADMAAWCWTLLARGEPGHAYNVGSEEAYPMQDAAGRVAALAAPPVAVERAVEPDTRAVPSRYVPSTGAARDAFGLEAWISLDDSLRRTWGWVQAHRTGTA